jgi:hypothetical protein
VATLIIDIDFVGWTSTTESGGLAGVTPASPAALVPKWQNVTGDEMSIQAEPLAGTFPELNEIVNVRRHSRHVIGQRGGALISCDVIAVGELMAVRCVSKYRADRGRAMAYAAAIMVPVATCVVELSIRGSEHAVTGVREAIVQQELTQTAGPSERQQLQNGIIPIEWKFERYEPGTRADLAYLLSDDEKYDCRFPDHPLSSVRRLLLRVERTFCVTGGGSSARETLPEVTESRSKVGSIAAKLRGRFAQPDRDRGFLTDPPPEPVTIQLRQPEVEPMSADQLVRELGRHGASDALLIEGIRGRGLDIPPLAQRQEACRERMDADLRKVIEQSQERAREMNEVRTSTDRMVKELAIDTTYVWIPQLRNAGQWFTLPTSSESAVLPVFTSTALIDDFIEAKQLDCEAIRVSLKDLFVSFSELRDHSVTAMEFNHCPRCTHPRPANSLGDFHCESDLLRPYAGNIASQRVLAERNRRISLQETDPAKRLAMLRYTLQHIDPGMPAIHLEIAKIAVASGDSVLLERSRQMLTKYAPAHLPLLSATSSDSRMGIP